MKLQLVLVSMLCAHPVLAETKVGNLTGNYYFSEESCGADGKAASCKLTIELTGKAARALYDRMKATAIKDECAGGTIKTDDSGLTCYKSEKEYNCHFGYNISKRKFTSSDVSC